MAAKKISDIEYEHVLEVWNTFKIKTMKDYHNLYFNVTLCDILLLVDVFEKFRFSGLKDYGFCLSHNLSD